MVDLLCNTLLIQAKAAEIMPLDFIFSRRSKESERKDYDDNMQVYEHELKVPCYLIFYPDEQELTLYRHTKRRYVSVKPNKEGRLSLPELDLEMAILDGWCRFWYRGELLPLPADLLIELEQTRRERDQEKQRADREKQRADAAERELELLRGKLKKMRGK